MMIFPMFLLVAFRAESIGNDTLTYANYYRSLIDTKNIFEALSGRMENGYILINYFFSHLGLSWLQFQIIITMFMYYSIYRYFYKYSVNIGFSCLLFMLTLMGTTMAATRMCLAISILLFSVPYILKRKFLPFLLIVFIAFFFHKSSLVFVMIYPLCALKYERKRIVILMLVAIAIAYLGTSFFGLLTNAIGEYQSYVEGDRFSKERSMTGVTLILIVNLTILVYLLSINYLQNINQYKQNIKYKIKNMITSEHYIKVSFLITVIISIIGLSGNTFSRISNYFDMSLCLIIPSSLSSIHYTDRKIFIHIVIIILFIIKWFVIIIYRPEWNYIVPYQFY
ncbi:MAG: EpsG family protein [Bacteroidales bacterium]|nr:EpsG family protein [Bacteroidales bacterium]